MKFKYYRGYVAINFGVTSPSSFQDNREHTFPDAEVGGGAGDINAICSKQELSDDVISGYSVETFRDYRAAKFVSF